MMIHTIANLNAHFLNPVKSKVSTDNGQTIQKYV